MTSAAVWWLGRRVELSLEFQVLPMLAAYSVLAASFALLLLPPTVAVLALLGVIQ